ncbi:Crp/Fnr family transcriptional regulator [Sphingomonas swuensis]
MSVPALDAAFSGNRLLATLSAEDRALLEPSMRVLTLESGTCMLDAGDTVTTSLFPFDGLIVSLQIEISGNRSVEVASIGMEGAVGGIVSCGVVPAFAQTVVQLGGHAAAVPMKVLEAAKLASPHIKNLFCRYADALLAQIMQSVACNAFHPIEARAARWLLHAHDRAGSERLALTQESLAGLLGVQRTTVNAVARVLQEQGLIAYRRGAIQVVNRAGLSKAACGCYRAVEDHFQSVLGPSGRGGG